MLLSRCYPRKTTEEEEETAAAAAARTAKEHKIECDATFQNELPVPPANDNVLYDVRYCGGMLPLN